MGSVNRKAIHSVVHRPGMWLGILCGSVFTSMGVAMMIAAWRNPPEGCPVWVLQIVAGIFTLLGATLMGWSAIAIFRPVRIRHNSCEVLPNVPCSPVLQEGSTVHGRLTHELYETVHGHEFRPSEYLWRNCLLFLVPLGIAFLSIAVGVIPWGFREEQQIGGWVVSSMAATILFLMIGGTAFVLIGLALRASYRRLSRLSIPRDGDYLELDTEEPAELDNANLTTALQRFFVGTTNRCRVAIPRDVVVAVQLCPWKFVVGDNGSTTTTWAVQGLLVLSAPKDESYQRLPLLLTSDFVGAARTIGALADVLQVPYLFHGDADGWKAEAQRAKTRQPIKSGGIQS